MKKITDKTGNNNKTLVNGVMALFMVALIALGCTCGKDFDLSNIGKESDNRTVSNTSNSETKKEDTKTKVPTKKADASKGEMPADDELQYLAKTSLLDFNDAIQKADFSSFHSNLSKTWQKQITAEKFKQEFQAFIDKGVDISAISSEEASFSPAPSIDKAGGVKMLVMKGSYDISPSPTTFELKYVPEGKEWKLFGIDVRTKSFK
jgi:hypothetical protein